jgi:hypothetical protein
MPTPPDGRILGGARLSSADRRSETPSTDRAEQPPHLGKESPGWPERRLSLISRDMSTHRMRGSAAARRGQHPSLMWHAQAPGLTGGIDCGKLDGPTEARGVEVGECGESALRYRRHGKGGEPDARRSVDSPSRCRPRSSSYPCKTVGSVSGCGRSAATSLTRDDVDQLIVVWPGK